MYFLIYIIKWKIYFSCPGLEKIMIPENIKHVDNMAAFFSCIIN
jgi:hypothetical protein